MTQADRLKWAMDSTVAATGKIQVWNILALAASCGPYRLTIRPYDAGNDPSLAIIFADGSEIEISPDKER